MNELILTVGAVALFLNLFSFLFGLAEWIWFIVIMQVKSPGIFWKWQNWKYRWMFNELNGDTKEPFTILLDLFVLVLFVLFGCMLAGTGLLFPLVLVIGAIWCARIYVAKSKAES